MADKSVTITQPPSVDATLVQVTRANGVTRMFFIYEPTTGPRVVQTAEVLDSELIAGDRTNLNASLLAAYNIAKTKMGF